MSERLLIGTQCSVEGCDRGGRMTRGLCSSHYARWRRLGDVRAGVPIRRMSYMHCDVPGCERPHLSLGLCERHYRARDGGLHVRAMLYGLTNEQLAAMLGRCAICGTTEPGTKGWQVDHDHACCPGVGSCGNCVRGVLCVECNMGIGRFHDDPARLLAAIDYLTRPKRER